MCVCVYMCVCVCVCVSVYVSVCAYVCMYVCADISSGYFYLIFHYYSVLIVFRVNVIAHRVTISHTL